MLEVGNALGSRIFGSSSPVVGVQEYTAAFGLAVAESWVVSPKQRLSDVAVTTIIGAVPAIVTVTESDFMQPDEAVIVALYVVVEAGEATTHESVDELRFYRWFVS